MHSYGRRAARRGFTLLEVLLASAIAGTILYGLYLAIDVHLRFADAGRNTVEEATLARSLMARIASDVTPCVGQPDPGRFRQTSTPAATSPTTPTTPTSGTGGMNTGTGGMTGMTDMSSMEMEGEGTGEAVIDLSRAFVGDTSGMTMFISRVPRQADPSSTNSAETAQVASDQRLVVYWICEQGGLARQEIPVSTGNTATAPLARGTANENNFIIAKEVTRLELSYFNGTDWMASWDGNQLGPDNQTPLGPPLAVAIVIDIELPGSYGGEPRRRTYRHVVAIPTANGPAQQQPPDADTMEP
jgi:prepilin-type N-terminal cleavage/methylation domain-containing protein